MRVDNYDRYAPPGYFGSVHLYFVTTVGERRQRLAQEYRSSTPNGQVFNLRLHAPTDSLVQLRVNGADAFGEKEVVLVRKKSGRSHNLKEDTRLELMPGQASTPLALLIGTEAFVEETLSEIAPETAHLLPNYPNPFRHSTTIEYSLPERQHVRIEIYDILGRLVRVLADENQQAGFHTLTWDSHSQSGRRLASGVYFYQLMAGGQVVNTKKMVVVR
jgi:hypothetical protein